MMSPKTSVKIGIALSIAVAVLFLVSGMAAPMSSGMQANNFTAAKGIQPYTTLNSNVTWNTFYSRWNPIEYNNGTPKGNLTLNAQISTTYRNPITINPSDIIANGTLQNNKLAGEKWNSATPQYSGTLSGGAIAKVGNSSEDGIIEPYLTLNTSAAAANGVNIGGKTTPIIDLSNLPSNNPAYDYITAGISLSGNYLTGISAHLDIWNMTKATSLPCIHPGQSFYITISLAQLQKEYTGATFNLTGKGTITGLQIQPFLTVPKSATPENYKLTYFAQAVTEYPILIGQNATGQEPTEITGNAKLTTFDPSEPMQIINNGYTVAVSQPLQKATIQENAISGSNYIEQVEYEGSFALPSAPDLSYSTTTLTEQLNISSTQVQVIDINGQSYLNSLTGKNGTIILISAVNPTQTTTFLQIVDYTQAQWNSISSAPGLFTIMGIEYYWWIAVGGLATLLGLAAAAKHAGTKADQERIPKKGGR